MKKNDIKILLYCVGLLFVMTTKTLAASASSYTYSASTTASGSEKEACDVIYNQLFTLDNVKVKFTQTDDKYTFKVTGNSSYSVNNSNFGTGCKVYQSQRIVPMLYKKENFGNGIRAYERDENPYASFSGSLTSGAFLQILSSSIFNNSQTIRYKSDGSWNATSDSFNENGEKAFIPTGARPTFSSIKSNKYPCMCSNDYCVGASMDNNSSYVYYEYTSSSAEYVAKIYCIYNATISIEKKYIDDYRYLCFGGAFLLATNVYEEWLRLSVTGYSMSTNTIDLKDYINCEHEWSPLRYDQKEHILKCDYCEWEKKESHTFEYEYDGIADNMCACTEVKKVHYTYTINDDYISEEIKSYNVGDECQEIASIKKTGYNFLWYEKHELQVESKDLKNIEAKIAPTKKVFVATVSSLDNIASNFSTYYKAVYAPIEYTFVYSTASNVDKYISDKISYDKVIAPQTFHYDEKDNLRKHIDYDYLTFKGWSLTNGGNDVVFKDEEEILNYTTKDKSIYILYPIYETDKYQVLYNTLLGAYDNGSKQTGCFYDFYTDEGLLIPKNMGSNKVFSHYVDLYGNHFDTLIDIRNYIIKNIGDTDTSIVFAIPKEEMLNDKDTSVSTKSEIKDEVSTKSEIKDEVSTMSEIKNTVSTRSEVDNSDNSASSQENESKENESKENERITTDSNSENNKSESSGTISSGGSSGNTSGSSGSGGSSGGGNSNKNIISSNGSGTNPTNILNPNDILNYITSVTDQSKNNNVKVTEASNSRKITSSDKRKKDDKDKKELLTDEENSSIDDRVYGPIMNFDDASGHIVRGPHGPWYLEQKYIDAIMLEKKKLLMEKGKNDEKIAGDNIGIYSMLRLPQLKIISLAVGAFMLIILIIIYEIFTIKYFRKIRDEKVV
ncbi:MAG: hypothetical protein J6O09_03820 [Lachnospiraceae bacterium]|nr:hypothetical protein [Lachnospiraceae bacterium]